MAVKRYVLLNGIDVQNVILLDDEADEYTPPEGLVLEQAAEEISLGWKFSDGNWIAPVLPEPEAPPVEDPAVTAAKESAYAQLTGLGISDANARLIVGLPPA